MILQECSQMEKLVNSFLNLAFHKGSNSQKAATHSNMLLPARTQLFVNLDLHEMPNSKKISLFKAVLTLFGLVRDIAA